MVTNVYSTGFQYGMDDHTRHAVFWHGTYVSKDMFVLSSWGAMWDEPAARPISSFGADRLALQPVLKEDPRHVPDINPYRIVRNYCGLVSR
jgi:hypothetical protein